MEYLIIIGFSSALYTKIYFKMHNGKLQEFKAKQLIANRLASVGFEV